MKLRELVAVEVMGAKVITTIDPVPDGIYVRNGAVYYGNDAGRNRCERFTPDTNIADAWRVVEKMQHREPIVRRVVPLPREDGKPRWRCLMLASDDPEDVEHHWIEDDEYTISRRACVAEDENVCVAICIAALRAVGVSEGRIEQARKGNT